MHMEPTGGTISFLQVLYELLTWTLPWHASPYKASRQDNEKCIQLRRAPARAQHHLLP